MSEPFGKRAILRSSPAQFEVVRKHLCTLLAVLRAQSVSYHTSHWQAQGSSFYGDHLLFQRLYEAVEKEVDSLAEKIAGYLGAEVLSQSSQTRLIAFYATLWEDISGHYERGLKSEEVLQKELKDAYDRIKSAGAMTLGLDDFLMALANSHDSHIYLQQQALGVVDKSAKSQNPGEHALENTEGVFQEWIKEIEGSEHQASVIDYSGPNGLLEWNSTEKRFSVLASELPRKGAEIRSGIMVRSPRGGLMKFGNAKPTSHGWHLEGVGGHSLFVWSS